MNEEFEKCKSTQNKYEKRAKAAEAKIVNLNANVQVLQDALKENANKINNLEQ